MFKDLENFIDEVGSSTTERMGKEESLGIEDIFDDITNVDGLDGGEIEPDIFDEVVFPWPEEENGEIIDGVVESREQQSPPCLAIYDDDFENQQMDGFDEDEVVDIDDNTEL